MESHYVIFYINAQFIFTEGLLFADMLGVHRRRTMMFLLGINYKWQAIGGKDIQISKLSLQEYAF